MSSSIELQESGQASQAIDSPKDRTTNSTCPLICSRIIMVAIPTLIISGVLLAMFFYGMNRIEAFASSELDNFLGDAREMLSEEIETHMATIEEMVETVKQDVITELEGRITTFASNLTDPVIGAIETTREQMIAELRQAVRESVRQGVADALNETGSLGPPFGAIPG